MSARSAITGPGLPPTSVPTTPVCATPVFTSIARARAEARAARADLAGEHVAKTVPGRLVARVRQQQQHGHPPT